MAGGAREQGRSVTSRVLAILDVFDAAHTRLTLSGISRRSGLPLSTVHRLVGEFERWRAVESDPDGGYRVGLRLWELGQLAPGRLRRPLQRPTCYTVTEPGRLARELADIRRRGWAVTREG